MEARSNRDRVPIDEFGARMLHSLCGSKGSRDDEKSAQAASHQSLSGCDTRHNTEAENEGYEGPLVFQLPTRVEDGDRRDSCAGQVLNEVVLRHLPSRVLEPPAARLGLFGGIRIAIPDRRVVVAVWRIRRRT